ncbi:V-type proton ATPase 16 kDa proteolipid subunit, partial [Lachnellula occidentalis]
PGSGTLACSLCCWSARFRIGIVGNVGVRETAQQPRLIMETILIFGEALGLYSLIIALLMIQTTTVDMTRSL